MYSLSQIWRLFITIVAFFIFGIIGIFLTLVVLPILLVCYRRHKRPLALKVRGLIHISYKFLTYLLVITRVMTLKIKGLENLKKAQGCLIIANHPTLLDVVVLMGLMPHVNCIVKNKLRNNIFMGRLLQAAGYIFNDGAQAFLDQAQESFQKGDNLIVFPQGTRSVPKEPLRFQRGFANIIVRLEAPLLPIYIKCTPPFLYKQALWYKVTRQIPSFTIEIEKAVEIKASTLHSVPTLAVRKLKTIWEENYNERLTRT